MTKTYNFISKSKKNNNNSFCNNTDYSSIIDSIIIADIKNKNKYLFDIKNCTSSDTSATLNWDATFTDKTTLNDATDFIKAAAFLANYKANKHLCKTPYIIGKMYELTDGTPIVFYDDEIQIGFDTYSYTDFSKKNFLSSLTGDKKKIIIKIYGNANININL